MRLLDLEIDRVDPSEKSIDSIDSVGSVDWIAKLFSSILAVH